MFRRGRPHFYAFDALRLNGRDLRGLPLLERKRRLVENLPALEARVLYLDHIRERGEDFFKVACERDLEGIVGKYARGTYQSDGRTTSWLKVKNVEYSQMERRHELFETAGRRGMIRMKLPQLALRLA